MKKTLFSMVFGLMELTLHAQQTLTSDSCRSPALPNNKEMAMTTAKVQKAKAGISIAEKSYHHVKRLFDRGVISAHKLDDATAQRGAATERAARLQYKPAKNGAQREDKEAAAQVNRARGAVPEVNAYISESQAFHCAFFHTFRAPLDFNLFLNGGETLKSSLRSPEELYMCAKKAIPGFFELLK